MPSLNLLWCAHHFSADLFPDAVGFCPGAASLLSYGVDPSISGLGCFLSARRTFTPLRAELRSDSGSWRSRYLDLVFGRFGRAFRVLILVGVATPVYVFAGLFGTA